MSVLQSQFEAGDLTAGYILAMNLRYCWNSPFNQHEFDTRKQTQQETHASDAMLQHLEDKYENSLIISKGFYPAVWAIVLRIVKLG